MYNSRGTFISRGKQPHISPPSDKGRGKKQMKSGNLTREQAIQIAGLEVVKRVENEEPDFTGCLFPEVFEIVEFSASADFVDSDSSARMLTAYYYQDQKEVDECDDLSNLDWDIEGYEID